MNIDNIINAIKSILSGTVPGSVRFLAVSCVALTVWVGVLFVSDYASQLNTSLSSQRTRFSTLLMLASQYKNLSPASFTEHASSNTDIDVATVFASVSERMALGTRVNRISPDGRNQAVEINRLYAEEFEQLQRQLASRGVRFIAAELRALPSGSERLLTVSAIIGPMN